MFTAFIFKVIQITLIILIICTSKFCLGRKTNDHENVTNDICTIKKDHMDILCCNYEQTEISNTFTKKKHFVVTTVTVSI